MDEKCFFWVWLDYLGDLEEFKKLGSELHFTV